MATNQTLFDKVIAAFPELTENALLFINGTIILQNDSDGSGDYIAAWNYSQPLPASLESYLRA